MSRYEVGLPLVFPKRSLHIGILGLRCTGADFFMPPYLVSTTPPFLASRSDPGTVLLHIRDTAASMTYDRTYVYTVAPPRSRSYAEAVAHLPPSLMSDNTDYSTDASGCLTRKHLPVQ